jgi:hypothetical protein
MVLILITIILPQVVALPQNRRIEVNNAKKIEIRIYHYEHVTIRFERGTWVSIYFTAEKTEDHTICNTVYTVEYRNQLTMICYNNNLVEYYYKGKFEEKEVFFNDYIIILKKEKEGVLKCLIEKI